MPQHSLRHTPEQNAAHSRTAVRCHDNQVSSQLVCNGQNPIGWGDLPSFKNTLHLLRAKLSALKPLQILAQPLIDLALHCWVKVHRKLKAVRGWYCQKLLPN
jgi:hypothetical protein